MWNFCQPLTGVISCSLWLFSPSSPMSLRRSKLLLVRMLSTVKIRRCLWAPLVLLALVSHVPSKAQDQGMYFSSSPNTFLPFSPAYPICFQSLHLFPSSLSSPVSTSSLGLMCGLIPIPLHCTDDHITSISPHRFSLACESVSSVDTLQTGFNACAEMVLWTVMVLRAMFQCALQSTSTD